MTNPLGADGAPEFHCRLFRDRLNHPAGNHHEVENKRILLHAQLLALMCAEGCNPTSDGTAQQVDNDMHAGRCTHGGSPATSGL